ncbi:MAG: FtsX-like permease family protein [Chitinivibrionales bacterium]|nr:FtsX-like permease family protein [Chitinivibrionales bacterium]
MLYLLKLAFRNLLRNTRRSLLAVLSVMLSIMFIVFMQGMLGGFMGSLVRNYTRNETGHIRIATRDFVDKVRFYPVTENIENPDSLIAGIKDDPDIAKHIDIITKRIYFGVLLNNRGNNKNAVALAGDPATEKDLLLLHKSILPGGRYIRNERETIIGAGLAEALDFKVGDTVKVMAQGGDYALHLRKFAVVGIFESGLKDMDERIFQIPLSDAEKLLRMKDETQQIILMLDNYHRAEQVASAIEQKIGTPELSIQPWREAGIYGNYVTLAAKMYNIIYFVIALLGAFIIGNIMMMVVLERRREIGVLKSMGLSRIKILFLFISEGIILGLAGSLAGVAGGSLVSWYFHIFGLDFSKALSSVNMPMDSVVYTTIDTGGLAVAVVLGTLVSGLVSIIPSWQAARMNAVNAIKSV